MSLAMHLYSTCQVKLCWCRSSLSQLFFKIGVLKYFAICTGKQEKRLQHRFFPVNIAKFLRTIFYRTSPVAASVDVQSIEITPKISLSVIHVTSSNVYVFTLIHRKGFICLVSWKARKQINDVVLKTFLSSAKSLHCSFRMKHQDFLTSHFILVTH